MSVWHVIPEGDLREHTASSDCWCVPELDYDSDSCVSVWLHRSADGREAFESGEREYS